jgi:hypothetical protein
MTVVRAPPDVNFDAKFGLPPAEMGSSPPLPTHVVLLGQLVVNAALLLLLQPVFVLTDDRHHPSICPLRVLALSLLATGATYVLHVSGVRPEQTYWGALDLCRRARS